MKINALKPSTSPAIRSRDHVIREAVEAFPLYLKTWEVAGNPRDWMTEEDGPMFYAPHGWVWARRECGEPEMRCTSARAHAQLKEYRPVLLADVVMAREASSILPASPAVRTPRHLLLTLWHLEKLRATLKPGTPQHHSTEQRIRELVYQVEDLLLT